MSKFQSSLAASIAIAFRDFRAGLDRHELWLFLGWREVKRHYQRSLIGPFWLTLNMGILVGGLGVLYSQIFRMDIHEYLPFLALGFILWSMIGGVVNDACTVFSSAASTIKQVRMPLSVHVFQFMWKHIITFLHNITIFVVLAVIFRIWPGINGLLFIPAFLILVLNGLSSALILGTISARFRDIPPIVASVTQICFFLTPIIWSPSSLPDRAVFLTFNPFYHLIEITRQPLLGHTASALSWIVCIAMTAVTGIVAVLFFSRFRSRIAYWA